MAVLEAIQDLGALPDAGAVADVDRGSRAVHRFDGGEERLSVRQLTVADFADGHISQLGGSPAAVLRRVEPEAFLGAREDLLAGAFGPANWLEVVRHVADVIDDMHLPLVLGIGGFLVGDELGARAHAGLVADAVEGLDNEVPAAFGDFDPLHAVGRRFVVQFHRFPLLGAICRRDKVEHRAALHRVGRIPAGTDGDRALAGTVDVARGDADVVVLGEILGDDVLLPVRVVIPLHRGLVGQDDVGLAVAIDVGDRQAVTDLDLIDLLQAELRFWRGGCDGGKEEGEERGRLHGEWVTCPTLPVDRGSTQQLWPSWPPGLRASLLSHAVRRSRHSA